MSHDQQVFGAALRRRRVAAGLSLSALAAKVHYTKGYLSKIETGRQRPSADLARRCDVALTAGGELAVLVPRGAGPDAGRDPGPGFPPERHGIPWQRDREGADREAPGHRDPGYRDLARTGDEEVWVLVLGADGTSRFVAMNRRTAMAMGAGFLLGVAAPHLVGTAREPTALDSMTATFSQLRLAGQVSSPAVVLPTIVAHTHAVRGVALAARGPAQRQLLLLAGRCADFAGWMAQEGGNDQGALWWIGASASLAEQAGDLDMATFALVRRAEVRLYQEDGRGTVELAARAQADPRVSARVRGLAAEREAQGHALNADYDNCRRSLDRAAELLTQAAETDRPAPAVPRAVTGAAGPGGPADPARPVLGSPVLGSPVLGSTVPDPSALAGGWCLHDLGRPAEAAASLERALAAVPSSSRRAVARFGARRALAYAAAGEIEQACLVLGDVLDAADQVDSATVRSDLRQLARLFAQRSTVPAVRAVAPRLHDVLFTPPA